MLSPKTANQIYWLANSLTKREVAMADYLAKNPSVAVDEEGDCMDETYNNLRRIRNDTSHDLYTILDTLCPDDWLQR